MDSEALDYDELRRRCGDDSLREDIESAEHFGFDQDRQPGEQDRPRISATPYQCRDPREIPQRPWVYGRQLLRGSLSVIVAPGAVGKTALTVGTALALATGRPLLDKPVWGGPKRVWLWNLEDSGDEMSRLVEAARLHWRISAADLGDRLFIDSALDGAALCIATEDNAGFRILEPVVDALVAELVHRQIDVLVVDPFVSCHTASENNNGAIDAIAKRWARVGVLANCAVGLVHHTKKLNGAETTAEGARGASALPNAARSVLALNRMSSNEATQWGIEGEDSRRFFRAYDDKNNRAPPASKSDWYQLASINLGNGPDGGDGDSLPVVLPWTPPDAFTGLTWEHLRDIQAKVAVGAARKDPQSADWVGLSVAEVLGLDVADRKGKDAMRVKALLEEWIKSGALIETKEKDAKGNLRPFIRAGEPALGEVSSP